MNELPTIPEHQFKELVLSRPSIVDVRAPVEFAQGHIPGSINIPILNNEHRQEIGLIYKQRGQEAAVKRGHELVSGDHKINIISQWREKLENEPHSILTCFRGGKRSQLAQQWLAELGLNRPRVAGGYKDFRQYLLLELQRLSSQPMVVISGPTGSGKTKLINQVKTFRPAVNLEALAHHRGSAFGQHSEPQPSQADYENCLAYELIKYELMGPHSPLVVEDESRMIGKTAQPEIFFDQLRQSPLIYLEESVASRVQVILEEYILELTETERLKSYARYFKALEMISGKLGGVSFEEIKRDLSNAVEQSNQNNDFSLHSIWIEKLLLRYYDPLYLKSFERRNPNVVFRGSREHAQEYLKSQIIKN
jgi:tRNA 2-selenouridine synthase